ncbi:DUF1275 domain-containing protein [Algoriphagus sp. H41]|uniref:DUF1275 domain-containing protein n=1 Tax=Algoriphagus oliviformis TaxID=2811231 RepID=A0ABS3C522_9BACT|nr:YoaK family protein [Algoriphagus oliviformis]MBN7812202.1 DUF1275 domain-containing protein [Algoriphagus oliviformis]
MFRHQGKNRTLRQNIQIATILSFVAGLVNVTGFLAYRQLTTNVTGHFALFINDVAQFEGWRGLVYFAYIFFFLLGSFCSGFLIEKFRENKKLNVFVLPTAIECGILLSIPFFSALSPVPNPDALVCSLLFAMGLQNSFVTKISSAVVRTTHLTGLFTDLGIELSQLFFPKTHPQQKKIRANIQLRLFIISFFFLGGLAGGFLFSRLSFGINTLIVGAAILFLSLIFDDLRFRFLKTKRKYRQKKAATQVS